MKNLFALSFVLATIAIPSAVCKKNYCSMACDKIPHIGCNPPQGFDARSCGGTGKLVTLTDSLQKLLVDEHNQYRDFIAGGSDVNHKPACRMATMKWSKALAKLATLNVYQCMMKHDYCHNTPKFEQSGQNLYEGWLEPPRNFDDVEYLKNAVLFWFNEKKDSNQAIIDSYPVNYYGPAIGHFTAMMVEKSTHVGCAAATYIKGNRSYYLVACNYAMNNVFTKPIYTKCQRAASACSNKNPLYKNLCHKKEKYILNKWD